MIIRRKPVGFDNLRKPQSLGMNLLRNGVSRLQALTIRRTSQSDEPIDWGDGIPDDIYQTEADSALVDDVSYDAASADGVESAVRRAESGQASVGTGGSRAQRANRSVQRQPAAPPAPPRAAAPAAPSGLVRRQALSEGDTMPSDLKAIYNMHKNLGHWDGGIQNQEWKPLPSRLFPETPSNEAAPAASRSASQSPAQSAASSNVQRAPDADTEDVPLRPRRRAKIVDMIPPQKGLPFGDETTTTSSAGSAARLNPPVSSSPLGAPLLDAPVQRTPESFTSFTPSVESAETVDDAPEWDTFADLPSENTTDDVAFDAGATLPEIDMNSPRAASSGSGSVSASNSNAESTFTAPATRSDRPAVQRTPEIVPSTYDTRAAELRATMPRTDAGRESHTSTPASTFDSGEYTESDDESGPAAGLNDFGLEAPIVIQRTFEPSNEQTSAVEDAVRRAESSTPESFESDAPASDTSQTRPTQTTTVNVTNPTRSAALNVQRQPVPSTPTAQTRQPASTSAANPANTGSATTSPIENSAQPPPRQSFSPSSNADLSSVQRTISDPATESPYTPDEVESDMANFASFDDSSEGIAEGYIDTSGSSGSVIQRTADFTQPEAESAAFVDSAEFSPEADFLDVASDPAQDAIQRAIARAEGSTVSDAPVQRALDETEQLPTTRRTTAQNTASQNVTPSNAVQPTRSTETARSSTPATPANPVSRLIDRIARSRSANSDQQPTVSGQQPAVSGQAESYATPMASEVQRSSVEADVSGQQLAVSNQQSAFSRPDVADSYQGKADQAITPVEHPMPTGSNVTGASVQRAPLQEDNSDQSSRIGNRQSTFSRQDVTDSYQNAVNQAIARAESPTTAKSADGSVQRTSVSRTALRHAESFNDAAANMGSSAEFTSFDAPDPYQDAVNQAIASAESPTVSDTPGGSVQRTSNPLSGTPSRTSTGSIQPRVSNVRSSSTSASRVSRRPTQSEANDPEYDTETATSFSAPYTADDPQYEAFNQAIARAEGSSVSTAASDTIQRTPDFYSGESDNSNVSVAERPAAEQSVDILTALARMGALDAPAIDLPVGRANSGYTTPAQPPVQRTYDIDAPESARSTEADLLHLMGLPADTPIQRGAQSSGTANRDATGNSVDTQNSVQREVQSAPQFADTAEQVPGGVSPALVSLKPEETGDDPAEIEKMAQAVYRILRQRLKVERERSQGRAR